MKNEKTELFRDIDKAGVGETFFDNGTEYIVLWRTECNGFKVTVVEEKVDPIDRMIGMFDIGRRVKEYLQYCKRNNK